MALMLPYHLQPNASSNLLEPKRQFVEFLKSCRLFLLSMTFAQLPSITSWSRLKRKVNELPLFGPKRKESISFVLETTTTSNWLPTLITFTWSVFFSWMMIVWPRLWSVRPKTTKIVTMTRRINLIYVPSLNMSSVAGTGACLET